MSENFSYLSLAPTNNRGETVEMSTNSHIEKE